MVSMRSAWDARVKQMRLRDEPYDKEEGYVILDHNTKYIYSLDHTKLY